MNDKTFTNRNKAVEYLNSIFAEREDAYVDVLVSNEGYDTGDQDHPDYLFFKGYAEGSEYGDQITVAYGTSGKEIMISPVE